MGSGAMTGVTYIPRVNTKRGTAPAEACTQSVLGQKRTARYGADCVFDKM
jgi:hypothetical protein